MQTVLISAAIAYAISGLLQLRKDLGLPAGRRPTWALHPSLENAVLAGATWFVRIFVDVRRRTGPGRRALAVTLIAFGVHMAIFTAFVWGCIAGAAYLVDGTLVRMALTAVCVLLGAPAVSMAVDRLLALLMQSLTGV